MKRKKYTQQNHCILLNDMVGISTIFQPPLSSALTLSLSHFVYVANISLWIQNLCSLWNWTQSVPLKRKEKLTRLKFFLSFFVVFFSYSLSPFFYFPFAVLSISWEREKKRKIRKRKKELFTTFTWRWYVPITKQWQKKQHWYFKLPPERILL